LSASPTEWFGNVLRATELSYYADQLLHMATAVPTYGRRTARVWTRKVLYSSIWRKNKASLELPEVGDATYDAVMPELFSICEEEYGFKHNDERVCKAMFKVRVPRLPRSYAETARLKLLETVWKWFAAHGRQARGQRGTFHVSCSACASSCSHVDPERQAVEHVFHCASNCVFRVLRAGGFSLSCHRPHRALHEH
jgi:hypothetical protein